MANEDDQFECYGIFYLNKWTENETEVKKTIRQTVENYSKNIQKGQDQLNYYLFGRNVLKYV